MNQLFPLRSSSFQKWLGPKRTEEVEATTSLTPHHSLTMFSEWETSCCGQCVSHGVLQMIQKKWWALKHKPRQKGPLSFTPAHKYKIRTVMHKMGKKIPQKNLFQLHNLVFIYPTFSHLQHLRQLQFQHFLICVLEKRVLKSSLACTLTSLRSISSARRKLSRALLLPNPHGRSIFPLCKFLSFSFSTVQLFCCLLV